MLLYFGYIVVQVCYAMILQNSVVEGDKVLIFRVVAFI